MYKSQLSQFFLAFFLGPIGLLYSSVAWSIGLIITSILLYLVSPFLCIFVWFISIIVGFGAVADVNAAIKKESIKEEEKQAKEIALTRKLEEVEELLKLSNAKSNLENGNVSKDLEG